MINRTTIRRTVYHGTPGFSVTSRAGGVFGTRIFTPCEAKANAIAAAVRDGRFEDVGIILLAPPPQTRACTRCGLLLRGYPERSECRNVEACKRRQRRTQDQQMAGRMKRQAGTVLGTGQSTVIQTREVLAAAYPPSHGGAMLSHACEVGTDGAVLRVLCGRVQPQHMADECAADPRSYPTCLRCRRALARGTGTSTGK